MYNNVFLNNAEVAKYYSQSPSDFIFYLFLIAFIILYPISLKKQTPVFLFLLKNTVFHLEIWCSFFFFSCKVMKILGQKWLCRVLPETRLLLERAKFKSLVTSSYWPLSSLLQKVSNLYYHPKKFLKHKTCL